MNKFEVTLKQLREHGACVEGYNKVVSALKGVEFDAKRETYIRFKHDAPIPLLSILESRGLADAIWCLLCNDDWARDSRLFAVWCARQVQHLITDARSVNALDVAEMFANGNATGKELNAAGAAAAAAWAAASDAASDAAWAAGAAARAAAWAAAWAAGAAAWAAGAAAGDAAWAAAGAAARAAAWAAAGDAARDAQKTMLIKMCNGTAPWQLENLT